MLFLAKKKNAEITLPLFTLNFGKTPQKLYNNNKLYLHGIKNKNRAQIPYVTLHFADVIGEARYQLLTNPSFRLCSHSDTTQFHVQTLEVALCSVNTYPICDSLLKL